MFRKKIGSAIYTYTVYWLLVVQQTLFITTLFVTKDFAVKSNLLL